MAIRMGMPRILISIGKTSSSDDQKLVTSSDRVELDRASRRIAGNVVDLELNGAKTIPFRGRSVMTSV